MNARWCRRSSTTGSSRVCRWESTRPSATRPTIGSAPSGSPSSTKDEPYNTRLNLGLPPTPIGNPGLASLKAAAKPADKTYLYYVRKPGKSGEHAFSSTDAQFERDRQRYEDFAQGPMIRLGVCGWPVAHSRSPQMHNAALALLGLDDWHYQLLPLPPHLFTETVRALPKLGFRGVNVTIPHKEQALALADVATETATAIGAANTLTFLPDGTIHADNTDAGGFLSTLKTSAYDRTALVLGAGGSSRAIVYALRQAGAREVRIWNRNPERAQALADEFGAVVSAEPADIIVNCTSIGLENPGEHVQGATPPGR